MVSGMYAGETQKDLFGPRDDGVVWMHFHESLPVKMGKTIVDQIDDRTYSTRRMSRTGLNTFPVDKGEPLLVSYVSFGGLGCSFLPSGEAKTIGSPGTQVVARYGSGEEALAEVAAQSLIYKNLLTSAPFPN